MEETTVLVPNISCGHCTATIEREIGELPGVLKVSADVQTKKVTIQWTSPASLPSILDSFKEIGYPAEQS